jgi:citrate/tricarballylate utilization protein
MAIGFRSFWRAIGGRAEELTQGRPLLQALRDAATLRYLGGGGHGCNDRDGSFSTTRRYFHHLMAYGFLLCFAATSVATIYDHVLAWPAPYPFFSIPVLLGVFGGLGLMLIGVTGLLLLGVRATGAMGTILCLHLGLVLAFFLTMPYSKFVHGLYRTGALIRHAIERPGA